MKKKILLVEDTPMSIAVVTKEIEHLGYECVVAKDGEEAVKKAVEHIPDLIVMDISLPKMDGLQATAELRKNPRTQAIPVLAATARAMPGDRERCKEAGCDDYLSKPFGHKELGARIEKLLNERE
jgi:CheY-like chemotaxis protein